MSPARLLTRMLPEPETPLPAWPKVSVRRALGQSALLYVAALGPSAVNALDAAANLLGGDLPDLPVPSLTLNVILVTIAVGVCAIGGRRRPGGAPRWLLMTFGVLVGLFAVMVALYRQGALSPALLSVAVSIGLCAVAVGTVALVASLASGLGVTPTFLGVGRPGRADVNRKLLDRGALPFIAAGATAFILTILGLAMPIQPSDGYLSQGVHVLVVGIAYTSITEEVALAGVSAALAAARLPLWLVLALPAVLRSLYHAVMGVPGVGATLVLGAGIGFLYLRYRRIWPLVIMHAVNDGLAAFASMFSRDVWILAVAVAWGATLVIQKIRKRAKQRGERRLLSADATAQAAETVAAATGFPFPPQGR
ncbi:CPBP family intramembrane glutamic endopeptidase [Streptosporangium sp. NPDC020072]|uniref:CPBP family intramembrane glutamic endopeptidase n=1 Tax=Streptosporangium sp. NPDC020072 TaxID=3154788 RepID=UPI0034299964